MATGCSSAPPQPLDAGIKRGHQTDAPIAKKPRRRSFSFKAPIMSTSEFVDFLDDFFPNLTLLSVLLGIEHQAADILKGGSNAMEKCLNILRMWLSMTAKPTWELFCSLLERHATFNRVRFLIEEACCIKVAPATTNHTLTAEEVDQLEQFKVKEGSVVWMMLGVTGSGKSCTGNFILGQDNIFPESLNMMVSETDTASLKCSSFRGDNENLCMIDTPGLGDTGNLASFKSNSENFAYDYSKLVTELTKVMMMMDQGITAFLIVVPGNSRDYHGLQTLLDFCNIIGSYWNHSILVVTHGKQLGKSEEEQNAKFHAVLAHPKGPALLKKLQNKVSGRLVIVESKDWRAEQPDYYCSVVGKIMKYSKEITEQHGPFKDDLQSIGRVTFQTSKLQLQLIHEFENTSSPEAQAAIYQSTFKHVRDVVQSLVRIKMADGEDIDKLKEMAKLKKTDLNKIRELSDRLQVQYQEKQYERKEAKERLKEAKVAAKEVVDFDREAAKQQMQKTEETKIFLEEWINDMNHTVQHCVNPTVLRNEIVGRKKMPLANSGEKEIAERKNFAAERQEMKRAERDKCAKEQELKGMRLHAEEELAAAQEMKRAAEREKRCAAGLERLFIIQNEASKGYVHRLWKIFKPKCLIQKATRDGASHTLTDEEVDQLEQFKVKEGSVVWVMLGVTGAGKSCLGNFILGQDNAFPESSDDMISETERAAFKCSSFGNENLCVIDTPGLGDSENVGSSTSGAEDVANDYSALATELTKVMMMTDQGINAFLIVIQVNHRDFRGLNVLLDFCNIIGNFWKHSILVVTHGKELGKTQENQYAMYNKVLANRKGPASLKAILEKVSGRLVIAEPKEWKDQSDCHYNIVDKIMKYSGEITEQHGPFKDELQAIGREAYEKAKLELRNEFEDMNSPETQAAAFQSTFKHIRDVVHKLVRIKMADGEDVDKLKKMVDLKENYLKEVTKLRECLEKEYLEEKREGEKGAEEKQKQEERRRELAEKDKILVEHEREGGADQERMAAEKEKQRVEKDKSVTKLQKEFAEKDKILAEHEREGGTDQERMAAEKEKQRVENDKSIAEREKEFAKKDKTTAEHEREGGADPERMAAEKEKQRVEKDKSVTKLQKELAEKDKTTAKHEREGGTDQKRMAAEKEKQRVENDKSIAEHEKEFAKTDKTTAEHEREGGADQERMVAEKEKLRVENDKSIAEHEKEFAKKDKTTAEHEREGGTDQERMAAESAREREQKKKEGKPNKKLTVRNRFGK